MKDKDIEKEKKDSTKKAVLKKDTKVKKKTKVEKETVKKPIRKQASKKEEKLTSDEKIIDSNTSTTEEVREVIVERKTGFNYAEVIVIMIITLILGAVIGSFGTYVVDNKPTTLPGVTTNTEIPDSLKEFVDTYEAIVNDYYQEVDKDALVEAGIEAMLEFLGDDYSVYMDKDEATSFNDQVQGNYKGIGVEIALMEDGTLLISQVFDDTPASRAEMKAGDILVSVNGESVEGKTPKDVSKVIKGATGDIGIVVKRGEEELSFTLSLDQVVLKSVTSKVYELNGKKIGYMDLTIFASNTFSQFEKQLLQLEGAEIDSLIIDVRNNSGGYLSTVTDIASLFLNKTKVIYQLDTKGIVEQVFANSNTSRSYDIVVLTNESSASASEILAGALQESYGAKVVGTNSFGKGTVQKAVQLSSGATVKYTIQKWLTPNGNWINEVGITPDINVVLGEEYYTNPVEENDTQLQTALEELSK